MVAVGTGAGAGVAEGGSMPDGTNAPPADSSTASSTRVTIKLALTDWAALPFAVATTAPVLAAGLADAIAMGRVVGGAATTAFGVAVATAGVATAVATAAAGLAVAVATTVAAGLAADAGFAVATATTGLAVAVATAAAGLAVATAAAGFADATAATGLAVATAATG